MSNLVDEVAKVLKNFYLDSHKLKEALMELNSVLFVRSWKMQSAGRRSFLSEHICDVKIRALWREAGGLCPGHTQLLEKSGPPLPRAILYQPDHKSFPARPKKEGGGKTSPNVNVQSANKWHRSKGISPDCSTKAWQKALSMSFWQPARVSACPIGAAFSL